MISLNTGLHIIFVHWIIVFHYIHNKYQLMVHAIVVAKLVMSITENAALDIPLFCKLISTMLFIVS